MLKTVSQDCFSELGGSFLLLQEGDRSNWFEAFPKSCIALQWIGLSLACTSGLILAGCVDKHTDAFIEQLGINSKLPDAHADA